MISIAKEDFVIDLYEIPLGRYDVVLGTQWLATLGPILWDFGLYHGILGGTITKFNGVAFRNQCAMPNSMPATVVTSWMT